MAPQADTATAPPAPSKGKNILQDPKALAAMGLERTNNKTGFMYLNVGESASHWLNSLPHSSSPLLDLGSAYGVHTIHAIKAGRDVIAVDMDPVHIEELRLRVENYLKSPAAQNGAGPGKLVGTAIATLPDPSVCTEASVSGVLLTEVIHFMRPGQPQAVFHDIFRWLQPGGRLVVTVSASQPSKLAGFIDKMGFKLKDGRSLEEALDMIAKASGPELVRAAPTFMELPQNSPARELVSGVLYTMTTKELNAMAKEAGFRVEKCKYIATGKYPDKKVAGETVLLVAKKPDPEQRRKAIRTAVAAAAAVTTSALVYKSLRER